MNLLNSVPFNLSPLILTTENTRGLGQIKVLDIFNGGTKNFHPEGLFSVEIFGKVGDERRSRLYGYINLNVPIFHPVIYKSLVGLKELYAQIMAGTAYARFNSKTKDFEAASLADGETGYAFFVKYFPEIEFENRRSTSREFAIKLINKYRNVALMSKLIILPAGLRDYVILPNGKPEEDEINGLYRKVLSNANVIGVQTKNDLGHVDATRHNLQNAVQEVYSYIVNLLEGKGKLVQGWWTNRNVHNSTRNVITATVQKSDELGDARACGPNNVVVGIYQQIQAIKPLAVNLIRGQLADIFSGSNSPVKLVNPKTLLNEVVSIDPSHYDDWMTKDGIDSILNRFEIEPLRHDEIMVDKYYLALLYNDGKRVRMFRGLQDLPEGLDKAYVKPITYAEFFYLTIFKRVREIPAFCTRYPVIGFGGIYPAYPYMKTTTASQSLIVLNEAWEETSDIANEFPVRGAPFMNSMSPAGAHIGPSGADFDGDTMSYIPVMTEESVKEIEELLGSRDYYVGVSNKMVFSVSNDVSDLVFSELTSE